MAFQHFTSVLNLSCSKSLVRGVCVISCTIRGSTAPLSQTSLSKFCLLTAEEINDGCDTACTQTCWDQLLGFITALYCKLP